MTVQSAKFQAVIAEIDAANAGDPRQVVVGTTSRPHELVYADRMSECLLDLYPDASEDLRIAARAQHIRRWEIARSGYPLGRTGYNAWRAACREHHAALASAIMARQGYPVGQIAHVAKIIRKEDLKQDRESQALENAVAVVFAKHYLSDFVATHEDYDDDKLVGILRKTLRKLDAIGHTAIRALPMPPGLRRIVEIALS